LSSFVVDFSSFGGFLVESFWLKIVLNLNGKSGKFFYCVRQKEGILKFLRKKKIFVWFLHIWKILNEKKRIFPLNCQFSTIF
jgi:hypothetical protein